MDLNVSVYLIAAYTGLLTKIMPEFTKRNTKVIALSCNPVDSHVQWQADIMKHSGSAGAFPYPIVDDTSRELTNHTQGLSQLWGSLIVRIAAYVRLLNLPSFEGCVYIKIPDVNRSNN